MATGEWLLFIDADVLPTEAAFQAVGDYVVGPPVAVHFPLRPMTDDRLVRLAYSVANIWFHLLHLVGVSQGLVSFMLVPKSLFMMVGGFDEALSPGEDVDFVRRCSRVYDVVHHRGDSVLISPRRFTLEGRFVFALKTVIWEFQLLFGARRNLLRYTWEAHSHEEADRESNWFATRETGSQ